LDIDKLDEESLCKLVEEGRAKPIVKGSNIYVVYNTTANIFQYNEDSGLYEKNEVKK